MKSHEFLSDARKNPEQNPKVSPNEAIDRHLDATMDSIPGTNIKNLFVSFTSIPKLGINPQSKYNTPLGIYAYPAGYVGKTVGSRAEMIKLPFVGDQPWVNIFRSTGNIVAVDKLRNDNELIGYYEDLRKIMSPFERGEKRGGYMHYEDFVHQFGTLEAESNAKVDSPGGHFWYVTMRCAQIISERKGIARPVAWNWLFRKMGIDGFVDDGAGIIHENEPVQAVFFDMSSVEMVERVANKYSPAKMSDQEYKGLVKHKEISTVTQKLRQVLQGGSVNDLIEWLDYGANSQYMGMVPAQLRPQVLLQRPFYIVRIEEPSKSELYAAFSTSPGLMENYGQRLLKLLSMDDIVAILRKFNDRMDVTDLRRSRTVPMTPLKMLMIDVGDKGQRMDFITELLRTNLSLWDYIEDQYIPYAPGMREEYRETVYKIAKQQGSNYVIDDLRKAGAF